MKSAEPVVPACLAVEREVLGILIESDRRFAEALQEGLTISDFVLEDHRSVFRAMLSLSEAAEPVDYLSVAERLGNKDTDYALLGGLISGCVIAHSHVLHFVKILMRKSRLRAMLQLSEWMQQAATDPTADPNDVEHQARVKLDEIRGAA